MTNKNKVLFFLQQPEQPSTGDHPQFIEAILGIVGVPIIFVCSSAIGGACVALTLYLIELLSGGEISVGVWKVFVSVGAFCWGIIGVAMCCINEEIPNRSER